MIGARKRGINSLENTRFTIMIHLINFSEGPADEGSKKPSKTRKQQTGQSQALAALMVSNGSAGVSNGQGNVNFK